MNFNLADIKNVIGVIAVLLVFIGYVPYLQDIVNGKTVPHIYSWFLWGFVTTIAFALQISGGAGLGAFVTLAAAIMCIVVILLSLAKKSKRDITFLDTFFLLLAFISLIIWLFAKQPVLSTILTTLTDLLGFLPTIRKSWKNPFSETLSFYNLNTVRFGLATLALQQYSIVTALYPITWCVANGLFAGILLFRRKQMSLS